MLLRKGIGKGIKDVDSCAVRSDFFFQGLVYVNLPVAYCQSPFLYIVWRIYQRTCVAVSCYSRVFLQSGNRLLFG